MEGGSAVNTIFASLGEALTLVMGWIGNVLAALVTTDGALAALWPLAMVGIAFGLVYKGIGMIRSFTWGF